MAVPRPRVAVLATLDTKLEETRFTAAQIRDHGATPVVVNIGARDVEDPIAGVTQREVRAAVAELSFEPEGDEPRKVTLMRQAAAGVRGVLLAGIAAREFDAVIALGGGQGSWIASVALRDLPLGFPRLLVSTAGRDVGQYTQFSDLASVFSVTDIAGLNPLLRRVLATAAAGICGMAQSTSWREPLPPNLAAMTMYGITSAGAGLVMKRLREAEIEPVAFHANGVGGPTMEGQLAIGTFRAVLDWSITELADDVIGGICAAGPSRLTTAPALGIPQVVVPGGIDVVNFAGPETVPPRLGGRRRYPHTPSATLVRTNAEENAAIAEIVGGRISRTEAPVHVIVPTGGFSSLSTRGGPLEDRAADEAFLHTIRAAVEHNPNIVVSAHPGSINSPEFAHDVAEDFIDLFRTHANPTSGLRDSATRPPDRTATA